MSTAEESAHRRVAKGAALLDSEQPDWWCQIDLDTLAIYDPCHCIIGQLYGGEYVAGLIDLGIDEDADDDDELDVDRLGFDGLDHAALQAEWRRLILARKRQP